MNDTNIVCFLSVAKTKNISNTARQMNMTQQAVSRNIQKLEEDIGFKLLNRNTNKVVLTYAGKEFYKLFCRCDQSLNYMGTMAPWRGGNINVAWTDYTEDNPRIISAIEHFKQDHPDLVIRYTYGSSEEISDLFNKGYLDLIIISTELSSLLTVPAVSSVFDALDLYTVTSSNHPLAGSRYDLEELLKYPFYFIKPGNLSPDSFETLTQVLYAGLGITADRLQICNSAYTLFSQVRNTDGFTICPMSRIIKGSPLFDVHILEGKTESYSLIKRLDNHNPNVEILEKYFWEPQTS